MSENLNNKFDNERKDLIPRKMRITVFFVLLTAALMVAGHHFASMCNYDEVLGFNIHRIYPPWSFVIWCIRWHDELGEQLFKASNYGALVFAAGILAFFYYARAKTRSDFGNASLHGSAQWATLKQVKKMGIYDKDEGVFIGGWYDEDKKIMHYLRDNGVTHVLCFAPTRSGKGVSIVKPTLLSWGGSVVCTDMKGECENSAGPWQANYLGHVVVKFAPELAEGSAAWNPLDEIEIGEGKDEYGQVEMLATLIINEDGKAFEGNQAHWSYTARDFMIGVILYLLYRRKDDPTQKADLGELYFVMAEGGEQLYQDMANYNHRIVAAAGKVMMDKPEAERGSVASTAKAKLGVYQSPELRQNISHSDFHLKDIMDGDVPMNVYLVISPGKQDMMRPLMRIFMEMFLHKATGLEWLDKAGKSKHKHRVLMMVDEFPSFGKLQVLADGLSFVAGYGIKCYLITQDLVQLKEKYGDKESIVSNCHIQVAFAPNNKETAKYLSDLCGETTVTETHYSVSGKRMSFFLGSVSRNTQQTKRALITLDETMKLKGIHPDEKGKIQPGEMIIKISGEPPILGRQSLYFLDPVFVARENVPHPKEPSKFGDYMVDTPIYQWGKRAHIKGCAQPDSVWGDSSKLSVLGGKSTSAPVTDAVSSSGGRAQNVQEANIGQGVQR